MLKLRNSLVAVLWLLCLVATSQAGLDATADDTMPTVLARQVGQSVELRLKNGEKISGKLDLVGKNIVHLSQVAGAEFYEAVVVIDDVTAVVVRAKTK